LRSAYTLPLADAVSVRFGFEDKLSQSPRIARSRPSFTRIAEPSPASKRCASVLSWWLWERI